MEKAKIMSLNLYQNADDSIHVEIIGPSHEYNPQASAMLAEAAIAFAVTMSNQAA